MICLTVSPLDNRKSMAITKKMAATMINIMLNKQPNTPLITNTQGEGRSLSEGFSGEVAVIQ